jgi:WD40 repeat protein
VRNIVSHTKRVSSISWNRSVLSPYLITSGGLDTVIINHDVRMKNSPINMLSGIHQGEICTLSWSTNSSHELMK